MSFDPVYNRDSMIAQPWIPVVAILLYGVGIRYGQAYFAPQPRWDWRISMAAWNLGLSLFSAIGFLRTAPTLWHNFTHYTLQDNFCFDPESHFGSGSTGLWVQLFILSKFPELIDTFFIVIHKKPLIFLHWYHHISVLLYCWHSYVTKAPTGIIFCVMNYAVHAIMYFYYFLMAARIKPKCFNAMYITTAQISQMIVGVLVTIYGCFLLWIQKVSPDTCWLTPENNFAALLMYGSYLFLFLQFFWQRYDTTTKKPSHTASSSSLKTTTRNGTNNGMNGTTTTTYTPKIVKED